MEFTYPGVYVKELPSGPGPIAGVSTSNLGLIGFSTRGPVDYPTLCTSFTEFQTKFGTFTDKGLAPTMAYAFYQNGGQRLYFVRVTHDDAANALWDLELDITGETLGLVAEPSGLYQLQLDHMPVKATVPGSVIVTFANAGVPGNVNSFQDDGAGAMVSTGPGSGGVGSIDYETGEITIQLAVPGEYTGVPNAITAAYTCRVLRFEMKWPGDAGNNFRVSIQRGSDDYMIASEARWTRFTVVVEEDVNADPTNPAWTILETFADLVFDDPTSKNYVTLVINDAIAGSQYITVTDYGNEMNPPALAGTEVLNEDISLLQEHSDGSSVVVPDAYDGAWKGWKYTLINEVFPTTLLAKFQFVEGNPSAPGGALALNIGKGTNPASEVPILTWDPAAIVPGSLTITCDTTVGGLGTALVDDGLGGIDYPGPIAVGTVNYVTGAIALDLTPAADTFVADSDLLLDCVYAQPVTVGDDGNGNVAILDPSTLTPPLVGVPEKFQLNTSGDNYIDYEAQELVLTWKIEGNPAAGPCGIATSPTSASKTTLAGPWDLSAAATSFSLDTDNIGPVAVAITGTQAVHAGGAVVWPIAPAGAGDSCTVVIDGTPYVITAVGGETTELEFLNLINAAIVGGGAVDNATAIDIFSDTLGTDSEVEVIAGGGVDLAAQIGLIVGVDNGTGSVPNLRNVTATDLGNAITAAGSTAVMTPNLDGTLTIDSPTTGLTSELDFSLCVNTGAIGLVNEVITGTAGFGGGEVADYYTNPPDSIDGDLAGGSDGSATDSDDIVSPLLAADMRALYAFGKVDELMQLVAADFQTDTYVIDALITYAELMKDKFVVCAVPHGLGYQDATTWKRFTLNRYSSYGAIYYPHIKVRDPLTSTNVDVPPGGHVSGVYARTDANKNVGKAPGGMEDGVLAWSVGLEYTLTPAQVGVLNENKINALVEWPYTGRCVWGVRSMDVSGGEYPYIQMRRLMMFVEKSVFKSTHIHVFKNNGPQLWGEITSQLTTFLKGLFDAGYFAGDKASDAFFVVCNRSNNPENTVKQGVVYCDVGIAPNRPAEFIVFRFTQKALN